MKKEFKTEQTYFVEIRVCPIVLKHCVTVYNAGLRVAAITLFYKSVGCTLSEAKKILEDAA